jgi:hypothetical protein
LSEGAGTHSTIFQQFAHDGSAIIEEAVCEEACDRALTAFEALVERNTTLFAPYRDESGHLSRLINLHVAIPEFRDIFLDNKAAAVLDYVFNAKPCIYKSLCFNAERSRTSIAIRPFSAPNRATIMLAAGRRLEMPTKRTAPFNSFPAAIFRKSSI